MIVLVVAVAGLRDWSSLRASQSRVDELKDDVARTEASIARLQHEIHEMQTNDAWLERVARQELGVIRAGEIVVLLPEGR